MSATETPIARRRLTRNPWLWGALLGMLIVTGLRPVLRRVPEPPPVLGRLPSVELTTSAQGRLDASALRGRAHVISFAAPACELTCRRVAADLLLLAGRFEREGVDVPVVVVAVPPGDPDRLRERFQPPAAPPGRVIVATASEADACALARAALKDGLPTADLPCDRLEEAAHAALVALVDGEGMVRGAYRADALGLDELFHRALQVSREGQR